MSAATTDNASPPPADGLRLFVAISVPADVVNALRAVGAELADLVPRASISWTKPENLHLTLRFLGEVARPDVDGLMAGMARATLGAGLLPLACEQLGLFPAGRCPRVIWAGVADPRGLPPRLTELARRIAEVTAPFTRRPDEGPFTGHITLGRVRWIGRAEVDALVGAVNRASARYFGRWTARHVDLVRSELAPGGSRYTVVRRFPLEAAV